MPSTTHDSDVSLASATVPLKPVMAQNEEEHHQDTQQSTDGIRPQASPSHESTGSPERPSYSPVTPTLSQASLAANNQSGLNSPPSQWMEESDFEALPVSLDDNPDAIALRAALSILQLQRQQALKDMRDLDKMKAAALENPEQFVRDLEQGKLNRLPSNGLDSLNSNTEAQGNHENASQFGRFPSPQNVARTPPIEWKKYHIAGEPLDRLHQVQQHYPGFSQESQSSSTKPQPHKIAAPYHPFLDKLDVSQPSNRSRPSEG